jgi:hypothetical protein
MEKQLQSQPFVKKEGVKYKMIQITDIMLHTAMRRATISAGEKIRESFERNEPGRIYSPLEKPSSKDDKTFFIEILKNDPEFIKMAQECEAQGYKLVTAFPNEGIPIFAGEDTKQFLKSKNGKRFLRGIEKGKTKS